MLLLACSAFAGSQELRLAGPGIVEDTTLIQDEASPQGSTPTLEIKANKGTNLMHALLRVPDLVGGRTDQVPTNGILKEAWLTLTSSAGKPDEAAVEVLQAWAVNEPWDAATATWDDASTGVPWSGEGAGHTSTGHACGKVTTGSNSDILVDMVPCISPYLDSNTAYGWALAFADDDKAALSFAATDLGATVPQLDITFTATNADGDGWWEGTDPGYDCDDNAAAVNPGAVEIPSNGVDDDCDPGTPDGSGDTGTPAETGDTGRPPGLAVDDDGDRYPADLDCNDNDPDVYPGHVEWCDKLDNNCNGLADEECRAGEGTDPGCGCGGLVSGTWLSVLLGTAFARRRRR